MNAVTDAGFATTSLGEIAASLPGATAVFRRHKLDFCCGGGAALHQAVPPALLGEIEAELSALSSAETPAARQDDAALIAHILDRYHAAHRRELPELIRLARRVEAVHRRHPAAPHGLADLLTVMRQELEAHMRKEEGALFPMILAGERHLSAPITMMREEHDDHGVRVATLAVLTHAHTPPADACNSWRALYAGTRKLADDLMEHVHLENSVLFPRHGA
jgi:regulator of cell morphogenesis and NO signaling